MRVVHERDGEGQDAAARSPAGGAVRAVVLRAELLEGRGVPHCFTTRQGGYSRGVFASLNFGNPSELPVGDARRDPPEVIAKNWGLVARELAGARAGAEIVQVHQVHGDRVHGVLVGEPTHADAGTTTKADAIVTNDPSRIACVRVADCAPVLLAGFEGGRCVGVAAVHAGWRGVVMGVAAKAADGLRGLGARELLGAVGPCIGPDAFEVGPEVAAAFQDAFGMASAGLVRRRGLRGGEWGGGGGGEVARGEKFDVDLQAALVLQLRGVGVGPHGIDVVRRCTFGEQEWFFSHRRERGMTGRMAGAIAMAGA